VTPKIAVKITNAAGGPARALACRLTIGTTTTAVTTSATGWIISNDQSSGAATLAAPTKLLRLATGTAPSATVDRGDNGRINITVPASTVNLHVTDWRYAISHTNPNGAAINATIIRPATEAAATVDQSWEGVLCASGTVTARFVTGVTLRAWRHCHRGDPGGHGSADCHPLRYGGGAVMDHDPDPESRRHLHQGDRHPSPDNTTGP
jgi:hypothetical protein